MRFVMINSYKRTIQRIRQGLTGLEADHKGRGKSGTLRGGDGLEISRFDL